MSLLQTATSVPRAFMQRLGCAPHPAEAGMVGGPLYMEAVCITLGGKPLVGPLDVTVAPGEVTTIMGPSGVGKSTLLAHICGTLDSTFRATGTVRLAGRVLDGLAPESRGVGILFQDDLLFPHMSVGENLLFGLPPGPPRAQRREKAEEALAEAGLAGFFERDPATLSGGQRGRVAVLRTLLAAPRALLLDEPFAKLDADTRQSFREFVFAHARKRELPTLLVTHDPADAHAAGGPVHTLT